jgi:hypothetical protein
MRPEKVACFLGYFGLIPFVIPAALIFFVDNDIANMLEAMQFAYAGLIISFMGGVQWGYAVKQKEFAKPWHYIVSVVPTLVIFIILSLLLIVDPIYITVIMVLLLVGQAMIDNRTVTEKWFVKLRWVLTIVASLSLVIVGLVQAFYY